MSVSKSKNGDVDGGIVQVKRLDTPSSSPLDLTLTVLSDTDEYYTILKNKLHQVCTIVVLFHASNMKNFDVAHRELSFNFEDSLLYSSNDDEDEFPKRFKCLNLDYLRSYLNDNLTEGLGSRMQKSHKDFQQKESINLDFYEILYEKLTVCRFGQFKSSPALFVLFNNISLPTSIYGGASSQIWATFPWKLLLLAFSSYPKSLDVPFDDMTMPLDFSVVPDLPHLPLFLLGKPSCRNIKCSHKMQPNDSLVGHVLPILLAVHEFCNGCPNLEKMCGFSLDVEFGFRFNEVMRVTMEMVVSYFCLLNNDETVFLANDRDEIWTNSQRPKQFLLYHPVVGEARGNRIYNNVKFTTMITKVHKVTDPNDTMDSIVGLELFNDICPIEFKFDVLVMNFVLADVLCLIEKWVFMVILLKIQALFLTLIIETMIILRWRYLI
ncbi:hypothetical protein J1N35_013567 [Gossypium stocksii]|uniref:Uncharacterized protein n=1 Tax=Gossypium stocksii TaxID=47602 RepID=A0A9D3VV42_9ROSI|nr:hypothetical protein J1N35_013567 [Gossypium stocksii]